MDAKLSPLSVNYPKFLATVSEGLSEETSINLWQNVQQLNECLVKGSSNLSDIEI
jgi:hypothetical protein